jgi:hypothetical protein
MNLGELLKKMKDDLEIINQLNKDTFYIPTYEIFQWLASEGEHYNKQFKLGVSKSLNTLKETKDDYLRVNLNDNDLNDLLDIIEAELNNIIGNIEKILQKQTHTI